MLTNCEIYVRVLVSEFPDGMFSESLRAGIAGQLVKGSGENLPFRDWIPACPTVR